MTKEKNLKTVGTLEQRNGTQKRIDVIQVDYSGFNCIDKFVNGIQYTLMGIEGDSGHFFLEVNYGKVNLPNGKKSFSIQESIIGTKEAIEMFPEETIV